MTMMIFNNNNSNNSRRWHCTLALIAVLALSNNHSGGIHFVKANGDDSNFDPNAFGGDKPCPNFRCTKGMTPVPKKPAKWSSTGCSAMGGGMMMMGMGAAGGQEPFASCCDSWHACYQTCGSSKKGCDDGFEKCSAAMCGADKDCKQSADINSMMIKLGGCNKFDQAQYESCECVAADKVEGKRIDVLRYFYKKYSPDNVDKASNLAQKADTTSKMAGLLKKLLDKYPNAIKKVKDPQQEMMEKMMNERKDKTTADTEDGDNADDETTEDDSDEHEEL